MGSSSSTSSLNKKSNSIDDSVLLHKQEQNEKVKEKMKHEKVTEDDRNESFLKEKTSMKVKEPMITRKKENIVPKQAENEKIKPKLKLIEKNDETKNDMKSSTSDRTPTT